MTDSAPRPSRGDRIDLQIDDLALDGRGVGRHAGFVVFVDGALPGESVSARVYAVRRGFAEASLTNIATCSPDRITPRCRHYHACGGCVLQHLSRPAQARWKGRQVKSVIERIARCSDPPVAATVIAGPPWGYRYRMDFDWCAGRRPALGLHAAGQAAEIVVIEQCELLDDTANRLVQWLSEAARRARLTPWDSRRRRGFLRRAGILNAPGNGGLLVGIETLRGQPPALPQLATDLVRRFPRVVGVVRRETDRAGTVIEDSILAGRDHLDVVIDGDRFSVPAEAFFQPNRHGSGILREEVMRAAGPLDGRSVLELYCGVGFFTVALARQAGSLVGVEGSQAASQAARLNLRNARAERCRIVHADVCGALPELLLGERPEVVIVDPPRAGLATATATALAGSRVLRVVYVSCDPATFARDLRLLSEKGRFHLRSVVPLDLFPQTGHIELVACLDRETSG